MAMMKGCAIPVNPFPIVDHTYVISSSEKGEKRWGCFGRSAGGRDIAIGEGDEAQANQIAGQNGKAGIVYGITGVCHQTANRILFPSGKTVHRAGGYKVSSFFYGTYGLDGWRFLSEYSWGESFLDNYSLSDNVDEKELRYINKITNLYKEKREQGISNQKVVALEFIYLLKDNLDDRISILDEEKIIEIHKELYDQHERHVSVYNALEIDFHEFVILTHECLKKALKKVSEVIGYGEFLRIFDGSPEEVFQIINENVKN